MKVVLTLFGKREIEVDEKFRELLDKSYEGDDTPWKKFDQAVFEQTGIKSADWDAYKNGEVIVSAAYEKESEKCIFEW